MKKIHAVLYVYDLLLNNKLFLSNDLEEKFSCSRRTVIRYLNEVRAFVEQEKPEYEVVYNSRIKSFEMRLKSKELKIVDYRNK